MEDVEDVEDEDKVTICLPEPGPIGRPIVQVNKGWKTTIQLQVEKKKKVPCVLVADCVSELGKGLVEWSIVWTGARVIMRTGV